MKYCDSIYQTKRWLTREVKVGGVGVGGLNPIRIQSMTTSPTSDVHATVNQIIRLADAGCEIARVTVQGRKEALSCESIKNQLVAKGYTIPLVADIHFFPAAAEIVVDFVDKVRINPGNYLDKRATFQQMIYTDEAYAQELIRLEENFLPLLEKCKKRGVPLRIGTNHGSLSDRIMNRFGDTPAGMVESAFEYVRVCRKYNFHEIIFSMKASNPLVMIHAYRLLVAEQKRLGWNYPVHLGVTEAGEGEDGRVKSAIGMGSLLIDGIGDTVRVSLTEDPWFEIDPCKRLIAFAEKMEKDSYPEFIEKGRDVFSLEKRDVKISKAFPLHPQGSVGVIEAPLKDADFFLTEQDYISLKSLSQESQSSLSKFQLVTEEKRNLLITDESPLEWKGILLRKWDVIFFKPSTSFVHKAREFFSFLKEHAIKSPVILWADYSHLSQEDLIIVASSELGCLLSDGLGEGIILQGNAPLEDLKRLSFAILQGCRMRMVKTDFISCPSCGRTLFHLQEVSEKIRNRTDHLPGVKIAIMGCIVNGPGEMADADFGYVGSKAGKIDLYVGKECVERSIDEKEAVDKLILLIQSKGKWVEKSTSIEVL